MDVEALQAQIDLSNSIAYDLVSSWVKPSTSSSATSVSHAMSRELEEYAKRPPRLGLGATVSKSSLATSREAARLKGKLVGQKRRRDQSNDYGHMMSAPGFHNGQDDEDEGESRSAAISTKRTRVNGSLGMAPEDMEVPISPKKKPPDANSLNLRSIPAHVSVSAPNQTPPTPSPTTPLISPVESRPSSSFHLAQSPVSSQSRAAPLLNLHGPPLVQVGDMIFAHSQEENTTPNKKKRRRRRGKRGKCQGGEEAE